MVIFNVNQLSAWLGLADPKMASYPLAGMNPNIRVKRLFALAVFEYILGRIWV